MTVMPLDYPLGFDGMSYFGELATLYNLGSWSDGVIRAWGARQGPLGLAAQLTWAHLTGFSYGDALFFQAVVTLALIAVALAQAHRLAGRGPFWRSSLPWVGLIVIACGGILTHPTGGIFDYRLDLIDSLLLAVALLSIEGGGYGAAIWCALAVIERFHNLPVLIVSIALWRFWKGGRIRYAALGIAAVLILRFPQIRSLLEYYWVGHFGPERAQRGFGGWTSPGYFTYYPKALWNEYLEKPPLWALAGGVAWVGFFRRERAAESRPPLLGLSLLGGILTFVLLTLDPTRNQAGVLRYAWAPFSFVLIAHGARILDRVPQRRARIALGIVGAWAVFALGHRIHVQLETLDDYGLRRRGLRLQAEQVFDEYYAFAQRRQPERVGTGAFFNTNFNLNNYQWQIYLATRQLAPLPVDYLFGAQFYLPDFLATLDQVWPRLDFIAQGTDGCFPSSIPFNRDSVRLRTELNRRLTRDFTRLPTEIHLEDCEISVWKRKSIKI